MNLFTTFIDNFCPKAYTIRECSKYTISEATSCLDITTSISPSTISDITYSISRPLKARQLPLITSTHGRFVSVSFFSSATSSRCSYAIVSRVCFTTKFSFSLSFIFLLWLAPGSFKLSSNSSKRADDGVKTHTTAGGVVRPRPRPISTLCI
ncbi:unnamed protein product [Vicia faba]|uniref:Uncharacterized protein n=1 Tax=Vicia faba TaxID=3906 RepID=A0AAV0YJ72_VICFA|nr:unnamed protein product [Vicia faba]